MTNFRAKGKIKTVTFNAVVTRADGTVEDLGVIARYDRNPIKRLLYNIKQLIKTFKEKK